MSSLKKACSMVLTCLLLLSFTACGSGNSSSNDVGASTGETLNNVSAAGNSDVVTLTWYMPGNPTQMTSDGYNNVMAEVNTYLEEKIGVHLDLKIYSFSEYDTKCSTVISSGEAYDLMFTADWLNIFASNAGSNAFLALNDYLEEYAPDIVADVPDYFFKAMTINGQIFAMPATQNYAKCDGFYVRKDIADALGIEGSSYENGVGTYSIEDMNQLYADIKALDPTIMPDDTSGLNWLYMDEAYGFNYLAGFAVPGVVRFDDESVVINQFASNEFMEYCLMMRDWIDKGYMPEDAATYITLKDQISLDRKSDNHVTYRSGYVAPNVASIAMADCAWDETPVPIITSEKYVTTSGVTQSLTAVGVNSNHPEKAVELYNLVYTDEYLINTLLYGIEGVNYTKVSDTEVEIVQDSNYVKPLDNFAIANQFITWVEYGTYEADVWEQVKAFTQDANQSALFGFTFDSSSVKNEVANCSAIYDEYKNPLLMGAVDPVTVIPEMLNRMEQAGSERILEEMQKQIDEFLA